MTREDIEYATPRCWRHIIDRQGQHGVHHTCFQPMRYRAADNTWECRACGNEDSGLLIAARPSTIDKAA